MNIELNEGIVYYADTSSSHLQEQSDLHLQEDGPVHPTPHLHVPEK